MKYLTLIMLSVMLFSYTHINRLTPVDIEGSVIDAASGNAVSSAHVYVVKGEEEAISAANGTYRLRTWQSLPAVLTVEHDGHQTLALKITGPAKNQVIALKRK